MSLIRGRFQKPADKLVAEYTASIPFDWRLYPHDIAGSIAHARMLAKQGIISPEEAAAINSGLAAIREEIEQGRFQFKPELEDIHMNIEARLSEKIGEAAGKLGMSADQRELLVARHRLHGREEGLVQSVDGVVAGIQGGIPGRRETHRLGQAEVSSFRPSVIPMPALSEAEGKMVIQNIFSWIPDQVGNDIL